MGAAKEVDAILHLGCKFIPELDGELAVSCSECANESIFECLYGLLCSVDPVVVRFDQLGCHLLWFEVRLDSFGGLIVHDVYFWFEPFAYQIFKFFVYAFNNMRF